MRLTSQMTSKNNTRVPRSRSAGWTSAANSHSDLMHLWMFIGLKKTKV